MWTEVKAINYYDERIVEIELKVSYIYSLQQIFLIPVLSFHGFWFPQKHFHTWQKHGGYICVKIVLLTRFRPHDFTIETIG